MTDQDVKLPEPVAHVHSNGDFCADRQIRSEEWPAYLFTAEQVRAAILADRKLCAKLPTNTIIQLALESEGDERLRDFCAADTVNRDALQNFLSALLARG